MRLGQQTIVPQDNSTSKAINHKAAVANDVQGQQHKHTAQTRDRNAIAQNYNNNNTKRDVTRKNTRGVRSETLAPTESFDFDGVERNEITHEPSRKDTRR